ncbi:MAG: MerR family transcriptional regulator [Defluviitaleaceae bacterium]|nr:MerR family transcriptional regulator [Defluviitaleaceae bacterium]
MEMYNCRRCKKLFPRLREPICSDCIQQDEDLFNDVKNFLRDNPKTLIADVAAETGASAKKILGWLREGRLEIVGGDLTCKACGEGISTGIFCEPCQSKVNQDLDAMENSVGAARAALEAEARSNVVTMHSRAKK